jgi:hypothetical protein
VEAAISIKPGKKVYFCPSGKGFIPPPVPAISGRYNSLEEQPI